MFLGLLLFGHSDSQKGRLVGGTERYGVVVVDETEVYFPVGYERLREPLFLQLSQDFLHLLVFEDFQWSEALLVLLKVAL